MDACALYQSTWILVQVLLLVPAFADAHSGHQQAMAQVLESLPPCKRARLSARILPLAWPTQADSMPLNHLGNLLKQTHVCYLKNLDPSGPRISIPNNSQVMFEGIEL